MTASATKPGAQLMASSSATTPATSTSGHSRSVLSYKAAPFRYKAAVPQLQAPQLHSSSATRR
eukprot:CAMPEP_0202905798 /NCGR_PEP_ID=MMETSP1392-20130828/36098_1 /ASSEMBLY_ACC=CAM_ASM_000868 /TAXON_ID=225041 /ORGANISM="Chlamydomonas chlamydogama, Strain SAG 11-48b" /LENGTH=62 /DNA_ID=CAMNT_0049594065 /DNA_START=134 /DNA_END=319 /DNA_ORIENTATION=-